MKGLISIVMPVKNAGLYLSDCLESILKQTEPDWELLAVNDHSSDNSPEILESYAQKDKRIQTFQNQGNGIIPALQLAYKHSKGEYIHRMDADDLMPQKKLEALKSLLIEKGKGYLATGQVKYFPEAEIGDGYQKYEGWLNKLCEGNQQWLEIYKECVIASPNWLVHRKDFDKTAGFNSIVYPEDYDLVFRFYQQGLKVASAQTITHLWRDHQARSSRNLEVYKDNAYFDLKWLYFKKLELDTKRPLMIWGAGSKGKRLAKTLKKEGVEFEWVSNNPNKHGKDIYNQILQSFESILKQKNPQIIVVVGQRNAQKEIIAFFDKHHYKIREDYFFFC